MKTGYFTVVTNYRTFLLEAAGIGDAIATALNLLLADVGEYLRSVEPSAVSLQVVA